MHRRYTGAFALVIVGLMANTVSGYVPGERWTNTASGAVGPAGTPVTLTWSFAQDGASIPDEGSSNLIAYLDGLFDAASTSGNLTGRPWFTLFEQAFGRWSELGGVTFVYESNDSRSRLESSNGVLGLRGDVRLSGASIDAAGDTLAYAYLPDSGDIVVDTGETTFYASSSNNYRQLRNTIMHEVGHTLGLLHIESSTNALLMEPAVNPVIDGPQLDDIRGVQGQYGDALEKSNGGLGNGTYERATPLGVLPLGGTLAIGAGALGSQAVSPLETDFVSIANVLDVDMFSFDVETPVLLDAVLTPLGGVFSQGVEGGPQSSFNANARNDLALSVFAPDGTTLLGSADLAEAGGVELLSDLELAGPGMYFARVGGSSENVQMYQLELSAAALASLLAGDFDGNGLVEQGDLDLVLGNWGFSNLPAGSTSDLPHGIVDQDELDRVLANWGRARGLVAGSAIPEPSTLGLLLVAASLGLIALRNSTA